MIPFHKLVIYVSLVFLIVVLIFCKHKQNTAQKENFSSMNTAVEVEIKAGPTILMKANGVDLLNYTSKINDALYLALLKEDGTPRIIKPYATGNNSKESNELYMDLQNYFDKAKLLTDKYLLLVSQGTAAVKVSDSLKNYLKTTLNANKIMDFTNSKPYILAIDLINNSNRIEVLGKDGEQLSLKELLFSEERKLQFNNDGLLISGLQCYLDATRKESYNDTFGNVWKDISGKNRHFTWNSKPLYADGQMLNISKNGVSAIGPNADSFELGDGSKGFTIVLYSKTNIPLNGHAFYFENKVGIPAKYGIQAHIPWADDGKVYFDQGWKPAGNDNGNDSRVSTLVADSANYHVWVFLRNYDNSLKIYKDGNLIVSNDNRKLGPLELSSVPVRLGINWDANISKFLVYNTYFLDNEVKSLSDWIMKDVASQRDLRMKAQESKVPNNIPVRLGLQLFLDAKNYRENEAEWRDSSGNGYDFVWSKPPAVESNSIVLNGEYALSKKPSRLLNIDDNDTYTICWTSKTNTLNLNSVFKIMGNHRFQRGIFVHPTWNNNRIYFDQGGCCDPKIERVEGDVSKYSKDYNFYCIRKTKTSRSIFINGIELYTQDTPGSGININFEPMIIGRDLEKDFTWFANLRNFMVYNRDLSNKEITKLTEKFFSRYEFGNYSYDDADKFCRKQGMKLCTSSEYCKNGIPAYPYEGDMWGPIGDYPNGWVQIGKNGETCKTYQQRCSVNKDATCDPSGNPTWGTKNEREVAMLCCDVKYIPLLINAIYKTKNQISFFRDKSYQTITYKDNTLQEIYNVESIDKFKGLTSNFANGSIDGITITNNPNESLWCKGKYIMIYNETSAKGTETTFAEYFNGLSNDFIGGNLDAIGSKGPNKEYILFKKTKYCIVDMNTRNRVKDGLISEFSNMPNEFKLGFLDCVVYSDRLGCNYLLKNDKLIEYNFDRNEVIKGPIDISSEFPYLLPPFSSKDRECGVLENILKIYGNKGGAEAWNSKYYKSCKRVVKKEYEVNLKTYKELVDKYERDLMNERQSNENIQKQIKDFEKKLAQKRKELKKIEEKLVDIRIKPCKPDEVCSDKSVMRRKCLESVEPINPREINKKQIVVQEKISKERSAKFYELNPNKVNNCYFDPNVGKQFKDGFNFFAHPKYNNFVKSTEVLSINDIDITEHPDFEKYIPKSKIPKQKTARDFDITQHPDYNKYTKV
jgi:hypothetical protein